MVSATIRSVDCKMGIGYTHTITTIKHWRSNIHHLFSFTHILYTTTHTHIYNMRLLLLLLSTIVSAFAYMNEPYPPFIITSPKPGQQIKRGDTVNVTW